MINWESRLNKSLNYLTTDLKRQGRNNPAFFYEWRLRKLSKYLVDVMEVARCWAGGKAVKKYFAVASSVKSVVHNGENATVFPVSD